MLDFGNSSGDRKRRYDEFQVAFARSIKQAGFEPIAMNFGTGNGLGDEFLDYFAGTLETHRYLGFHEYDWLTMWRLHEENIIEKNNDVGWLHEPVVSLDSYWDSLMWYNHEIMKDDYVLGACLFVVGATGEGESFEHLGGIIDRLEALQRGTMPPPIIHAVPAPKKS